MGVEPTPVKNRSIDTIRVQTPLIVPSFSSRGFPAIRDIYEALISKLYGVCLVSSWDLRKGYLPPHAVTDTDVVIVDSRGYENDSLLAVTHPFSDVPPDLNWDLDQYREELTNIDETAIALTVNFDRWTDLRSQIEGALADKALVPTAASGFLVKPEARGQSVNIPKLVDHPSELSEFDVIGIAAKEIGHSLLTRCRSIVTLRSILQDAELDLPIHIFGAITPMEILSFFLCGADIFDGLNWLRYAYREQDLVRMEDYATCEWDLTDAEIHLNVWSQNLRFLNRLQGTMRAYANCEATMVSERFERHFLAAERIAQVAGAATQRVV